MARHFPKFDKFEALWARRHPVTQLVELLLLPVVRASPNPAPKHGATNQPACLKASPELPGG